MNFLYIFLYLSAKNGYTDLENISVDRGDVIIDKSFFKNIEIKSISLKEDYLVIDLS